MSDKIYTIIAFFLVGLVLSTPGILAGWQIYEKSKVIANSELTPATIVSCDHSTRIKKGRRKSSWAPVALTDSGFSVTGSMSWSNKEWCTSSIGEGVTVFLHNTNRRNSQINTFFQFWFLPVLYTCFVLLLYVYPIIYYMRKKHNKSKQDGTH